MSLHPYMTKHELKEITDMQLKFGGRYALKAPANCEKQQILGMLDWTSARDNNKER